MLNLVQGDRLVKPSCQRPRSGTRLGYNANFGRRGAWGCEQSFSYKATVPESCSVKNPQSDASFPQLEEDVMHTCFSLLPMPSLLNHYCRLGDIQKSTRQMARRLFGHRQVAPPFRLREECRDEAFKAVYVCNSSFPFIFFVSIIRMTPPLGYFCQLASHFHPLSLALRMTWRIRASKNRRIRPRSSIFRPF